MKKNCWEFKKCGREAGGFNTDHLGVCPATTEEKLHNVHDGANAGRACWVMAGTLCGGTVQGTFAQKYGDCQLCDFFRLVKQEEGCNYKYSLSLLNRIKAV
jgi:hypothetical protein